METVADFIFLGSIITADGDCTRGIRSLRREPTSDACVYYSAAWDCLAQLEKVALVVLVVRVPLTLTGRPLNA